MSGKRQNTDDAQRSRYEYRVWGKQRKARKLLARLGSDETEEHIKDCYLLVDDTTWNAKVRNNTLKVKQLVAEDKGFERWTSGRHQSADTAPAPFDDIFDELRLDRPQRGESYDLLTEVAGLDPKSQVRAMFVTKHRHRFSIDGMRAEFTDIVITETSEVLHTLSIEGDDLKQLVALRKKLGLRDKPNVGVHRAIGAESNS